MQLHAQLLQTGHRLLVVIDGKAAPFIQLLKALHFLGKLFILDLQRFHAQLIIGIIQRGDKLAFPDIITFIYGNLPNLSRCLKAQVDFARLADNAGEALSLFRTRLLRPGEQDAVYALFRGRFVASGQ